MSKTTFEDMHKKTRSNGFDIKKGSISKFSEASVKETQNKKAQSVITSPMMKNLTKKLKETTALEALEISIFQKEYKPIE